MLNICMVRIAGVCQSVDWHFQMKLQFNLFFAFDSETLIKEYWQFIENCIYKNRTICKAAAQRQICIMYKKQISNKIKWINDIDIDIDSSHHRWMVDDHHRQQFNLTLVHQARLLTGYHFTI